MRLAIADPPYLGRAATWYGGQGRRGDASRETPGRTRGRTDGAPEFHAEAARWDDPMEHIALMSRMAGEYDGWALAASAKTLSPLIGHADLLGARLAVWHVTNAIPDGNRVRASWEAVLVRQPDGRRAHGTGAAVRDVLVAAHPMRGFVGTKPAAWTCWVLDMLGYRPDEDELTDIFPGSGSVTRAATVLL